MRKIKFAAVLLITILFTSLLSIAQTDTVKIITSSLCSTCKEAIEHNLSFEKGVKSAVVDLETRELVVVYNPQKTDPFKIRTAVTKIGYDADSLKADQKAFKKLPECCRDPKKHR